MECKLKTNIEHATYTYRCYQLRAYVVQPVATLPHPTFLSHSRVCVCFIKLESVILNTRMVAYNMRSRQTAIEACRRI